MKINNKHILYIHLLLMLFLSLTSQAQNQKIKISPSEESKLIKEAQNKVVDYEQWLNTIGLKKNTKWYREDIESTINLDFESDSVPVFNNLNFKDQKPIHIKNYLYTLKNSYPEGVEFQHSLISSQKPCSVITSAYTFFYVKLTYTQTIIGYNYNFDKQQINSDTIDIYVKFIIRQLKPLATDLDKIYKIINHSDISCEESQENIIINNQDLANAKFSEGNEANILGEYAKVLVTDYANILNAVNNDKMNTKGLVPDYFFNDTASVYNDIIHTSNKIQVFSPLDYITQVKKYWEKDGIQFRYEIQEDEAKSVPGLGHMSVSITVKRIVETQNFKQNKHQLKGRIRVIVWFPIDEEGNVILTRGSGKIYKIEEKEYLEADLIDKANTYYWQVGIQVNTMNYFGELNRFETSTGTTPSFTRVSFGTHISKKVKPHWYLRFSYIWGILRGDDFVSADPFDTRHRYRYIRNLHFRNYIHEFAVTAAYEIFRPKTSKYIVGTYQRRNLINVYLLAGIGILRHNPQAKTPLSSGGNWISLRDLGTEGQGQEGYRKKYSLWQAHIPLGLGIKLKMNRRIDVGVEVAGRLTFTDYLDDVSGDYPAMEDVSPLARLMSNRTLETTSAITGESRVDNINRLAEIIGANQTYIGTDGNEYTTFTGFGQRGNQRGNPRTNDFYIVTGVHINYIFGK